MSGGIGVDEVTPADVHAVIRAFVEESGPLTPGDIDDSALLRDLDVDSLGLVDLLTRLERELGVAVPDDRIADIASVGDLVEQAVAAASSRGVSRPGGGAVEGSPSS